MIETKVNEAPAKPGTDFDYVLIEWSVTVRGRLLSYRRYLSLAEVLIAKDPLMVLNLNTEGGNQKVYDALECVIATAE